MQNNFLKNKILITSIILFMMVFSFADSVSALFFNTSSTPPNNNISYPINVGPDYQTKNGLMVVNGFRVLGPVIFDNTIQIPTGAGASKVLTSDAYGNATWQTYTGSNGGNGWSNTAGLVYLTDMNDNIALLNKNILSSGSLYIHDSNINNTFLGINAGSLSVTGAQNTGVGYNTLSGITSGNDNTGFGYSALNSNNIGSYNTGLGYAALFSNTSGNNNTAFGSAALTFSVSGNDNTSIGANSLFYSLGGGNTAVGASALTLESGSTASNNTAIGYNAEITSAGNLINAVAIGADSLSNNSNKIKIGNTSVTSIDLQVAWSFPSDLRLKENINDTDLGLEFIKKLRPVSYTMKQGNGIDYGFIAQEVESAIGKNTNIVLTDNTEFGGKTMRYTELIAPIAKAVQEQQDEIAGYRARLEALKERIKILESELSN